jgi:hypothetical protein
VRQMAVSPGGGRQAHVSQKSWLRSSGRLASSNYPALPPTFLPFVIMSLSWQTVVFDLRTQ